MPSSGSANYTVKGISNYASSGTPLSGTFTANFGAGELTGSIQNSALKIDVGTADIFGSAIAGFGTATATNPSTTATLASNGDVSGQFFGSAAQALAGIVSFSSNQYDTAFGGENRSEEHTSELQSLMRISYAVFCLKQKKNTNKLLR